MRSNKSEIRSEILRNINSHSTLAFVLLQIFLQTTWQQEKLNAFSVLVLILSQGETVGQAVLAALPAPLRSLSDQ